MSTKSPFLAGVALVLAGLLLCPAAAEAARSSDYGETTFAGQAARFFSLQDSSLRKALLGSLLLGLNCGLLGAFIVMRRMALVGDTLSHAVLPGIALGFMVSGGKNPVAILIGASLCGLFGIITARTISNTTRLKKDASLGLVLGSFFAVGICLVHLIPSASKTGINAFFFGKVAALGDQDVFLMGLTTVATILCIFLFYKGFLITSFDREYAGAIGLPVVWLDRLLLLLTAFSIVVAMQAVGVVLASAMLIIPAAAAYLLTDNMRLLLVLSALFGTCAAVLGAFLSFLGNNLPTGPFMVVGAATVFLLAFLFGPRHGWVTRRLRHRSQSRRVERENTLKALYRALENRGFEGEGIAVSEIADIRRESEDVVRVRLRSLVRAGFASLDGDTSYFTPEGYEVACTVVRNHRLWELYLTDVAEYEPDHVHDDAEKIEHILGADTVRRLERALSFPNKDPHGKPIPSIKDLMPAGAGAPSREQHGYG